MELQEYLHKAPHGSNSVLKQHSFCSYPSNARNLKSNLESCWHAAELKAAAIMQWQLPVVTVYQVDTAFKL
jgi:hypothetical protein